MAEDLTSLIEDSITDVELPVEPTDDAPVETTPDTPEPVETAPEPANEPTEPSTATPEVASPTSKVPDKVADDFEKKFGISAQSSSGRENRIPYSRVKRITEKAVSDAKSAWTKDLEKSYTPVAKFQELDTKVKDYEGRLSNVAEFERIMTAEPAKFLDMLARIPAYNQFFARVTELAQQAQQPQAQVQEAPVPDDMPQPDQHLSDGSKVYSMDGLKSLMAWQQAKAEERAYSRVMKDVESRYGPLAQDYSAYQQTQAVLPQVQRQISEARQWPLFNESEEAIVKSLQQNPSWGLERAYQAVVLPKMQADRDRLATEAKTTKDSIRAEVLRELKQAPRSTSVTGGQTRQSPVEANSGPKSLEDVIAASIKGLNK